VALVAGLVAVNRLKRIEIVVVIVLVWLTERTP